MNPAEGLGPQDAERARYTIALLNLNSPILVNKRREQWEELAQLLDDHLEQQWCLRSLAELELLPFDGVMNSFVTMKRQLLSPVGDDLLAVEA